MGNICCEYLEKHHEERIRELKKEITNELEEVIEKWSFDLPKYVAAAHFQPLIKKLKVE